MAVMASAVETNKVSHKAMKMKRTHENNIEQVLKWQKLQADATSRAAEKMQSTDRTAKEMQQRMTEQSDPSSLLNVESDDLQEIQREFLDAFHFDSSNVGKLPFTKAQQPKMVDPMVTYQKSLNMVRGEEASVRKQQDLAKRQAGYIAQQQSYIEAQEEKNKVQDQLRQYEAQNVVGLDDDAFKATVEDPVRVLKEAAGPMFLRSAVDDSILEKSTVAVQKTISSLASNRDVQDDLVKKQQEMVAKIEEMNAAQVAKNDEYTAKMNALQGVEEVKEVAACIHEFVSITSCGVNSEEDCAKVGIFAGAEDGKTTFSKCTWDVKLNMCRDADPGIAGQCFVLDAQICSTANPYPNLYCGGTGKMYDMELISKLAANGTLE
jgi:hypothetical protein